MHSERELLNRDLYVFETMVSQLGTYLSSEDTFWELQEPGMPKLTIGGCLMRRDRLQTLHGKLTPPAAEQLQQIVGQLGAVMMENVVRFEQRAHQELHARFGEWVRCLGKLSQHVAEDAGYYADKVDIRVVIGALVDQMQHTPFQLAPQILTELHTLDNNLRNRWQPDGFVWVATWQAAYPRDGFWYLYGLPR
ncbi:MAG: hypothetical protein KC425_13215 [Anaerolineales bacterium]|nr:hypothetical protein [Anaerolineales bacterium]